MTGYLHNFDLTNGAGTLLAMLFVGRLVGRNFRPRRRP